MLSCSNWWAILVGCWLMTLVYSENYKIGNHHHSHHRVKRKWVWNQFFVLEEQVIENQLYIGKLHSDSDNGNGSLRYTLSGEGAGTIFTIVEDKGDIYLMKKLDREEKPFYTLRAQVINKATDQLVEPESEFNIKVQDINDNEPRFLDGPYVATIAERSPDGTSVTQVTATDADDPSFGAHARIVYRILQGQPYFLIEPTTGIIRVALPNMDREVKERYMVIVEAKDMAGLKGGLSGTTTVTITLSDVNDNGPKFQHKLYHFSVPESADIETTIGKVMATDADIGKNAEMIYTVEGSDGSDTFGIFTNSETQEGVVILKKTLDYEAKRWFSLRVKALNKHVDSRQLQLEQFTDTTSVKINVLDVDEAPHFLSPTYTFWVQENQEPGAFVGKVTARDPDAANNSIRYSIDHQINMGGAFIIDTNSGTIITSQSLDREEIPWYNVSVWASEASLSLRIPYLGESTLPGLQMFQKMVQQVSPGQLQKSSISSTCDAYISDDSKKITSVLIRIGVLDKNDHSPMFPIPYETFVCENAKYGQLIQTISAVDKDDPVDGQHFRFALATDATSSLNFTVRDNQDNTAAILTRTTGFNRRAQAFYLLPILIEDNGIPSLSSTNTLTVFVCKCSNNGVGQLCNTEAFLLPAGLSTGALIAVVVCLLMILAIILLLLTLRQHKKEPRSADEGDDVCENIIRYDDEGGGEEDTQAFDITTLRGSHLQRAAKPRDKVKTEVWSVCRQSLGLGPDAAVFREFINDRLREVDSDPSALPYDSLQTYAFEGNGSLAGSLSSICSIASSSDPPYDYLRDWGPRFRHLAELYGNYDTAS